MTNNTAEKFLILIQHPDKSRFMVSDQIKNIGLVGSILLDLANSKNIEIDKGRIRVISKDSSLSQTHMMILDQIEESSRARKVKTWISRFSRQARKIQKELLLGLENKGVVKINPKSFLGIKYYNTELINSAVRDGIINDIRNILFNESKIKDENYLILGLIEACKMYKIIATDRREIRICKRRLKEIIKSDSISLGVDKVIKDTQAAIVGAMVAVTVATTVSSS